MEDRSLIYLDNAATSFPKPISVIDKMSEFMLYHGGNAGRGTHKLALDAAEAVYECRERLSSFFDADGADRVCFCAGTTEALNIAIKGLLRHGDHVLISDIEHNAVWRPIYKLWKDGVIDYSIFESQINDPRRSPSRICAEIARKMRRNTRMLICTGASNICSATMPLREIGEFCYKNGILFVVDGAQCAGHQEISVKKMKIDALCVPGHKGLLGPQGCGVMIFGKRVEPKTLIEGGNGISSLESEMLGDLPERLEAGTLPIPAIVGLSEGVRLVRELGVNNIIEHEKALFRLCCAGLQEIGGVKVYQPKYEGSVLLFSMDGYSSEELALKLSDEGICVRGGFHCCALGHKLLGTIDDGAVRASFGVFNDSEDVKNLIDCVNRLKN
jgi:cysteine desulfurase family protein